MDISEKEFINNIRRVKESRVYKITNSYGIYDGFKYYRKTRPKDKKYILKESQYYTITRLINKELANILSTGQEIKFPCRLGGVEVRKIEGKVYIKNGKIETTYPIDWDKTLKYWYEDKEAYNNKTLIKREEKEIFMFRYHKYLASYTNKSFYQFKVRRDIKKRLQMNIKNGNVDALPVK